MENVSKALLIAAGLLIVILLVTFGIKIFNSTDDVTEETTKVSDYMSLESQISVIDLQFSKYNGTQKGTVVKRMFDEVVKYNKENGNYQNPDDNTTGYKRKIAVYLDKGITNTENSLSNTGYDAIEKYKKFINEDNNYKIVTKKNLANNNQSIYLILIEQKD